MTLAELDALVSGRRVIRHHERCFVQVRDLEDLARFRELGATVLDVSTPAVPLWEVGLETMLDEETEEDENGELLDVRPLVCLAYFRGRDGYEWPAKA